CLTVSNGLGSDMTCQTITIVINDLLEPTQEIKLTVAPNPARQNFNITLDNTNDTFTFLVINDLGKRILKTKINDKLTVNTEQWPEGIYLYYLIDNEGKNVDQGKLMVVR
ncbi:MAG: T9SS C-terminal target domain-containing protein, partial [Bacteroidetes bacterium]